MSARQRVAAALLTISAAGFAGWQASEGFTDRPVIPTKGDTPTIGHGSTRYEDGTPVSSLIRRSPVSAQSNWRATLWPRTSSFSAPRYRASSCSRPSTTCIWILSASTESATGAAPACAGTCWPGATSRRANSLLMWRRAGGYDCSTKINGQPNRRCWGVWERQLQRHAQCLAAQGGEQ